MAAEEQELDVVATGLLSPRHLTFGPNGDLYIAESGVPHHFETVEGPDGTEVPVEADCDDAMHVMFGQTCLSQTAGITLLTKHGVQSQVVTGLPSLSNRSGEVNGAFDVLLHGNTLTVTIGLGGSVDPFRDTFENQEAASLLGTVIQIKQTGNQQEISVVADMAAYEEAVNPAAGPVDSNPVDLAWSGRDLVVTDAGGNAAMQISHKGASVDTLTVFEPVATSGTEAVPTSAAQGPDGAWYFSQLTGFPFEPGSSSIWRLDSDGSLEEYATGLTNVTDLAWDGDRLYAVQLANAGLLAGPVGSLVEVSTSGEHTAVEGAEALFAPYGVAIKDGEAYVTIGSLAADGSVVKFSLN